MSRHRLFTSSNMKVSAISNWLTFIVNLVIGLLLTPFVVAHLGKSGYGIWVLIGSFTGYYGLLNIGITSALTRYVSKACAEKDDARLQSVVSTAFVFLLTVALILTVGPLMLSGTLAAVFNVAPENIGEFCTVVGLLGAATGLTFLSSMFAAVVTALEYFTVSNVVNVLSGILRALLTVWLILAGFGLIGVAWGVVGSTAFALIANYAVYRRFTSFGGMRIGAARWGTLWTLLGFGAVSTVIQVADILRTNMDSVVIARYLTLPEVGTYGIGSSLVSYLVSFVTIGLSVLRPRFTRLDAAFNPEALRTLFLRSLTVSALLSFCAGMLLILFGGHFIFWWVGKDFAVSYPVLVVLTVGTTVAIAQNPGISLLYSVNKHYFYAITTIIEALANLALSIYLVNRIGLIGVAVGTLVPMLLVKIFVMPVYVSRLAGVRLRDYAARLAPPAVVGTGMVLLGAYLGLHQTGILPLPLVLAAAVLWMAAFALGCFLLMRREDASFFLSLVPRFSQRFAARLLRRSWPGRVERMNDV